MRAYVKRLRDKLADKANRPALIVNERGVGYRSAPSRSDTPIAVPQEAPGTVI